MDATALVGSEDDAAIRRFLRASKGVVDVNSGGSPQEVEWARPNVRVFFGGERHEGFSVIRVAVLLRQDNGQFKVLDTHIPPVLYLSAAPFLATGVRGILAQVVARQQQLAGERRQRQPGAVEFHAAEIRKFWMLHTLNGAIPTLQHLLDTPRTHPEEAYMGLAQLAGQLCSFSAEVEPTAVPKFNYLELGDVFETLFAVVRRLLPGVLKLASWNQVYDIVKQARHGVRVEIEWNPSAALPVKPGLCFFRVRKEGAFWDEIAKSATVALYLPADGEWTGATLSLYAVAAANLR
jgi:type VI secretion system protein ImpJ